VKFHQLAVGQAFRFEGRLYVKTSPMIACERESGAQRFLRRSSPVHPAGPGQAPAPATPLAPEQVRDALDSLHRCCAACLDEAAPHLPAPLLATLRRELEQARQDGLGRLALEEPPDPAAPASSSVTGSADSGPGPRQR